MNGKSVQLNVKKVEKYVKNFKSIYFGYGKYRNGKMENSYSYKLSNIKYLSTF